MTDEFDKVLQWGGSPTAQCGCGRTHFTLSGDFMDEGELDRLIASAKENPDQYIGDGDNDSVGVTVFAGQNHVWNCPCGSLDKWEKFFWDRREILIGYFRERTARELRDATKSSELLKEL